MKELFLKWLEIKKIKYEKLYCKHDYEKIESWNVYDKYYDTKKDDAIILFKCQKCGKLYKFNIND